MLKLHERFVVDATGHPVEVILTIADYWALLNRLRELDAGTPELPSLDQWGAEFRHALAKSDFATRDQILEMTRAIKREQFADRAQS